MPNLFVILFFEIFLIQAQTKDFFYLNFTDVNVFRHQNVKWTKLKVDMLQHSFPKIAGILNLEENNIKTNSITHILADYGENIKNNAKLRFLFTTKLGKNETKVNRIFIKLEISHHCQIVNNIYLRHHSKMFPLNIGISLKMCKVRNPQNKRQEKFALDSFIRYEEPSFNLPCTTASLYKWSPQLGIKICLCLYNSLPCSSFSECHKNGELCSNGGFCVNGFPSSYCVCLKRNHGTYCQHKNHICNSNNPCQNDGLCQISDDNSWFCVCRPGTFGRKCELIDYCLFKPCLNNGDCESFNMTFICKCKDGFTGKNCEKQKNRCHNCINGGECVSPDMGENYLCKCPAGFIGQICEKSVKPCNEENPCMNFGSCYNSESGEQKCFCPIMFNGEYCEKYSSCHQLCKNGGSCFLAINTENDIPKPHQICLCSLGYFGKFCEITHVCLKQNSVCKNEGKCIIIDKENFKCECKQGFHGKTCKNLHCLKSSDCLNGGLCKIDNLKSVCLCVNGFFGVFCQYKNDCYNNELCNKNGKCLSDFDGKFVKCQCNEGGLGLHCDKKLNQKSEL